MSGFRGRPSPVESVQKHVAFAKEVERADLARKAIKRGIPEADVRAVFGLSVTDYARFAGQVRAA
jgi:hypothetical protein